MDGLRLGMDVIILGRAYRSCRLGNKKALDGLIESWTKSCSAEEAMARLQEQGVPAGVVQDAGDLARDPQLGERGFFIELDHPEMGKTMADAVPIRLSGTPARYIRAAPLPGQDNDYVYGKLLGMAEDELAELKKQGVV